MNHWLLFLLALCMSARFWINYEKATPFSKAALPFVFIGPLMILGLMALLSEAHGRGSPVVLHIQHMAGLIGAVCAGAAWVFSFGPKSGGLAKVILPGAIYALALSTLFVLAKNVSWWWYVPLLVLSPLGAILAWVYWSERKQG